MIVVYSTFKVKYVPGREIRKCGNGKVIAGHKPVNVGTVTSEFPSKHLVEYIRERSGGVVVASGPTPALATRT
jgi:hypothetical protein